MLRFIIRPVLGRCPSLAAKFPRNPTAIALTKNFSQLLIQPPKPPKITSQIIGTPTSTILTHPEFLKLSSDVALTQVRTVTKFSIKTGKRKTVEAVLKRFKRLDWGIWIRTRAGRHKKIWKKSGKQRRRLRQHVFCNATQSMMLDKMVTMYWKRPKHYVDDPYQPFHSREDFWITRKKPIDWN